MDNAWIKRAVFALTLLLVALIQPGCAGDRYVGHRTLSNGESVSIWRDGVIPIRNYYVDANGDKKYVP